MIFVFLCLILHLVWSFLSPSVLLQVALFHSFLWLSTIPLYICTTSFSIHLLVGNSFLYNIRCQHILKVFKVASLVVFASEILSGGSGGKGHYYSFFNGGECFLGKLCCRRQEAFGEGIRGINWVRSHSGLRV